VERLFFEVASVYEALWSECERVRETVAQLSAELEGQRALELRLKELEAELEAGLENHRKTAQRVVELEAELEGRLEQERQLEVALADAWRITEIWREDEGSGAPPLETPEDAVAVEPPAEEPAPVGVGASEAYAEAEPELQPEVSAALVGRARWYSLRRRAPRVSP
jgi:hypothetical protein